MWALLALVLSLVTGSAWAQVTPTDPTEPTAFTPSFATSALSTATITSGDAADFKAEIEAITTCGVDAPLAVATYTLSSAITLPAVAGSCVGGAVSTGVSAISGSSGVHAISGSSGVSATTATSGGDDYIHIRSAELAQITAYGSRVVSADKTHMPTVIVPNGSRAFNCQTGSHHIRISGINFVTNSGQAIDSFALCQSSTTGADMHHIVFDRNYMTADATGGAQRGLQLGGANIAAIGNRITNVGVPSGSSETHGILAATGTGPYDFEWNEICAQAAGVFIGDSEVALWTGGSYGVGTAIIPSNGTIRKNYIHKLCITYTAPEKNLLEIKFGEIWKIDSNIFDTTHAEAQQVCIQLVSYRASQSRVSDISFTNNWVKNCPMGMGITFRPTLAIVITGAVSDGTTNCSGGGCIKFTTNGACNCTTGDLVEITGVGGVTGANNGTHAITRLTTSTMTVPVAFSGSFTGTNCTTSPSNCGVASFFFQAKPLERVKIARNLFTDIATDSVNDTTNRVLLQLNTNPTLATTATGVTDASISTTGNWTPNDFNFSHNTIVNPTAGDRLQGFISIVEPGSFVPYTNWKGARWAIRDNVVRISNGGQSVYGVFYQYGSGGGLDYRTNALNKMTASATRDFSHNLGFLSSFSDEATGYTGNDSWITSSNGSCASVAVLVDCTAATIAGAALQASSAGHNASSDVVPVDVGIDATALAAALSGVDQ